MTTAAGATLLAEHAEAIRSRLEWLRETKNRLRSPDTVKRKITPDIETR